MGVDQGHRQLVNLLEEFLEMTVLCDPCTNLRNQVLGNVDGTSLAAFLAGELLSGVQGAATMAAAPGPTAAMRIRRERSGENWGIEGDFFHPAGNHATNQSGMFGNPHGTLAEDKKNNKS